MSRLLIGAILVSSVWVQAHAPLRNRVPRYAFPIIALMCALCLIHLPIVADVVTYAKNVAVNISNPRRALDVTKAYGCGYIDGISHVPISHAPIAPPPENMDWCDEYTKIAHENGFNP